MTDKQGWEKALELLEPLNAQLDAALAAGNQQAALRLAFEGASEAARLVAGSSTGTPTLHRVYVELAPRLTSCGDGTLVEHGAHVNLAYQQWQVAGAEAERLAGEWARNASWAVDSS